MTYKFENKWFTPSPNAWLLNQFKPALAISTDAPTVFNGFRGVLKSYFPVGCNNTPDALATAAINNYAAFKASGSIGSMNIVETVGTFVDNCTGVANTDFTRAGI